MKSQDIYNYAIHAKEVNPNVLKSMAENIKGSSSEPMVIPLTVTKNGIYDSHFIKNVQSLHFDENTPGGIITDWAKCYNIIMDLPQSITTNNLVEIFEEKELNILMSMNGIEEKTDINNIKTLIEQNQIFEIPTLGIGINTETFVIVNSLKIFYQNEIGIDSSNIPDEAGLAIFVPINEEAFVDVSYIESIMECDGYFPVEVDVQSKVVPLTVTKNGIYDSHFIKDARSLHFDKDTPNGINGIQVIYYNILMDLPQSITTNNLITIFNEKELNILVSIDGKQTEVNSQFIQKMIELNAIKELSNLGINAGIFCMVNSLKNFYQNEIGIDSSNIPDTSGMVILISTTAETTQDVSYVESIIKCDGYFPVKVNIPQGKPIPVATETEMDQILLNATDNNIGTYYLYTGVTGKYDSGETYKLKKGGI